MKRITKQMLDHADNDELLEYINSLEEVIEEETDTEKTLDSVLQNVLTKYDYFKDPRHLKAGNIMAINGLLKTKKELRDSKIGHKKDLLATVLKKRESDAKNKTMLEISDKETTAPIDFKALLLQLDTLNVHPVITQEQLEQAGTLIDKALPTATEEVEVTEKVDNEAESIDDNT